MFLAEGKMLFYGQESMSVLRAAVVVCLQEQVGYSGVRDWEVIQMRQTDTLIYIYIYTFMYRNMWFSLTRGDNV